MGLQLEAFLADIGLYMACNPEDALDILAELAASEDPARLADAIAAEHSGANWHQAVAPWLRMLADALDRHGALQ